MQKEVKGVQKKYMFALIVKHLKRGENQKKQIIAHIAEHVWKKQRF